MLVGGFMRTVRSVFGFAGGAACLAGSMALLLAQPAAAAPARTPSVLALAQVSREDVPAAPGSEPDTLVEPDIAASPSNPLVAVAVGHDGRYPDGGAVGITHAWTRDGGLTWR